MARSIILSLLFISFFTKEAKCDRFIYKGDTSYIFEKSPLEQYPFVEQLRLPLSGYQSEPCWDCHMLQYDAEWTVINDQLYLTGIYSANYFKTRVKADINKLFNVTDGRVKASWVTTSIWIPIGKAIYWPDIMRGIYRNELLFTIENGKIKKTEKSPNSVVSIYNTDNEALKKFICTNIDWNKIPDMKSEVKKVFLQFEPGVSGKPENIRVLRGSDSLYNAEALRVTGILPWSILYLHGKLFREMWTIPVVFSEENRKFAKKP